MEGGGGSVDALSLADASEELVEREALTAVSPGLPAKVLSELLGQLGGQVLGRAPRDPLRQRLERCPGRPLGIAP